MIFLIEGDESWIHGGGKLGVSIGEAINRFVPADLRTNIDYLNLITKDIRKCFVEYDLLPAEYFYFGFWGKDRNTRREYLTDSEEDRILVKMTGYDKYVNDLSNKWHFYQRTMSYFHRSVMLFDDSTERETFLNFCLSTNELFIKPLAGSEGDGAFSVSVVDFQTAENLFKMLLGTKTNWMVEERIVQTSDLGEWNGTSVNTIRLPSFLNKNGFYVLAPILRTGRVGKSVDNTSAGGIFALIDSVSGIVCSEGYDINNVVYETHPDSGKKFNGYQIPKWSELLIIARELHTLFPAHTYIAWDFALTEKGWALVEGNWGRFRGAQIAGRKKKKNEFLKYMEGK